MGDGVTSCRPGGGSAGLSGWPVAELALAILGAYKVSETFWCNKRDSHQVILNPATIIGGRSKSSFHSDI